LSQTLEDKPKIPPSFKNSINENCIRKILSKISADLGLIQQKTKNFLARLSSFTLFFIFLSISGGG